MVDLPELQRAPRISNLRHAMSNASLDSFMTSDRTSIRWLSGFTGSAGTLLVTEDTLQLLTDGRYSEQAPKETAGTEIELCIGDRQHHKQVMRHKLSQSATLALEADRISWGEVEELKEAVEIALVPAKGLLSDLRKVKEPEEVARLEAAATIADKALAQVVLGLGDEPTEKEFARVLDNAMLKLGAESLSFETICASGPNAALPHARPSTRTIRPGDLVIVDFGAVVDGYHSDMSRTYAIGDVGQNCWNMLESVTAAQKHGCETVRPGVKASDVDNACRSHLAKKNLSEYFVHGTGHGVGLEIHEAPWINSQSDEILEEFQVVTVEPGVYRPGVGGVRVEDTVLVTSSGHRRLTTAPKDSVI
ncbi:MAG: Xaa-Pro peptidase family protein [Acidimicrobiales bacterium]|nr:Xaa-Pro peptidase family protein [Acidimicrobiales bacterium]